MAGRRLEKTSQNFVGSYLHGINRTHAPSSNERDYTKGPKAEQSKLPYPSEQLGLRGPEAATSGLRKPPAAPAARRASAQRALYIRP
jgi:hypothetical protein